MQLLSAFTPVQLKGPQMREMHAARPSVVQDTRPGLSSDHVLPKLRPPIAFVPQQQFICICICICICLYIEIYRDIDVYLYLYIEI